MNIDTRRAVLEKVFGIYDDFSQNLEVACKKFCDQCCTPNVTMTTLEGYLIAENMISDGKSDLFEKVKTATSKKRFQPKTTTNRLANLCIKGKDIPDEENDFTEGSCPLLEDHECPIYRVRPFGCRCFVSKHDCREKGYADVDPFIISVNSVFLQFVEHVDYKGFSGNLADILILMSSQENRYNYRTSTLKNGDSGLIANIPIKVLIIPPEHRIKIKPILRALESIMKSKASC
jgi:Fe-S-cluster containining protein